MLFMDGPSKIMLLMDVPYISNNHSQHAQWTLNKIKKTFNRTFAG